MLGEDRGILYTGFFTYFHGHISLFHSLTMGLCFVLARFVAVGFWSCVCVCYLSLCELGAY
jgi:hypothetical protein